MSIAPIGSAALEGFERYRLGSVIGRGSMGEVYRARDLSLGRDVAIKMLPHEVVSDERRIARLVREGRLLARLSHPHIATVHDVCLRDGQAALVMELVEGETLRERIEHGRLGLDEVLAIADQVTAAIGAAHAQGIVHCDLKPANIKLRPDGQVKVLDFGLARAPEPEVRADVTGSTFDAIPGVRGTPAYLSPELVAGDSPDAQSDIWAFGCVLFEMLTGRRAFARNSVGETLTAITDQAVDFDRLPAVTPPIVTSALRLCLSKDRRARLKDIGDARLMLAEARQTAPAARVRGGPPVLKWAATIGVGVLLAGAVGVWRSTGERQRTPAPLRRLIVPAAPNAFVPALSPDGRRVVYVADQQLWLIELDSLVPRALTAKEERVALPFWSPDSQSVAFFSLHVLSRISIGGARQSITKLPVPGAGIGGVWGPDGSIYFADGVTVFRVPASGGTASVHAQGDASRYANLGDLHLLPDGRRMLLTASLLEGGAAIAVVENGAFRVVIEGSRQQFVSRPQYVEPGWLVFARSSVPQGIFAVRFDLDRLRARGEPIPIARHASWPSTTLGGTVVMMQGNEPVRTLRWVDRTGRLLETVGEPQLNLTHPAIAPDGRGVAAVSWRSGVAQIWLHEGSRARLLTEDTGAFWPEWHADGTLFYSTGLDDGFEIRRLAPGATGVGQPVVKGNFPRLSEAGRMLWFGRWNQPTRYDVWRQKMDWPTSRPELVHQTPAFDTTPQPSPDGRYFAYISSADGIRRGLIRAADGGTEVRITDSPIAQVRWRGDQVFFVSGGALYTVRVVTGPELRLETPRRLFTAADVGVLTLVDMVDVDAAGQRFVVVQTPQEFDRKMVLVDNWIPAER